MTDYVTKDSGEREEYASGMVRDTEAGKPRFDLILAECLPYEEQMLTRFAALLARGAEKYGDRNWEKAQGEEELARAKASAFRHFVQWMCGEQDEDHAAAAMFNIQAAEYVKHRIRVADQAPDKADLVRRMTGGPQPVCDKCGGSTGNLVPVGVGAYWHAYGRCDTNGQLIHRSDLDGRMI